MTFGLHRLGLKAGAAIVVLGLAAGHVSAQNTNGAPAPFRGAPGRGRGPGGPGGPDGPGAPGFLGPIRMMASQLDLTDAQKDQIKSIAQSHAEEWNGIADREMKAREALQAAVNAAQFDEVTIRQKSAELAAASADAAVAQARARAEVVQLLTAAQQARLKEFEAQKPGPGRRGRRG